MSKCNEIIYERMSDSELEKLWDGMENIPFDEDKDGDLILACDYGPFEKGESRDVIWHWFDEHHSKGIRAFSLKPAGRRGQPAHSGGLHDTIYVVSGTSLLCRRCCFFAWTGEDSWQMPDVCIQARQQMLCSRDTDMCTGYFRMAATGSQGRKNRRFLLPRIMFL